MIFIDYREWILAPIFLLVVIFIGMVVRGYMPKSSPLRPYVVPGLMVKLAGGTFLGLVYMLYYGYGDTFAYFGNGIRFNRLFAQSPGLYLQLLFSDAETFQQLAPNIGWGYQVRNDSSLMIIKISSVLSFVAFRSYFAVMILYAGFFFTGVWALFRTFCKLYPTLVKEMAIAVLFVPSVFLWGSGLVKDTLCLGAVGWMTFAFYRMFFERRKVLWSLILLLIWGYILLTVKSYLCVLLAGSLLLWMVVSLLAGIRNPALKAIVTPVVILGGLLGAVWGFSLFMQRLNFTDLSQIMENALLFNSWNAHYAAASGSAYDIGEISPTIGGMLVAIPQMLNITYFRPYLWESGKIIILFSALESFALFLLFARILWKTRVIGFFKAILTDKHLFFFATFAVLLGFLVGLSSGTFGNLVRYKIPCMPFFVAMLLVVLRKE